MLCDSLSTTRLGPLDKVTLTIIMKCSDVDDDLCPSRDRENSCLTGSVPNDESSVLGTVLCNDGSLGQSSTKGYGKPEICAIITYHREHPQGFV